ncbi:MAG: type VI secretion system-associated FHA domain protein TagH [Pseudomonadota bacterium]
MPVTLRFQSTGTVPGNGAPIVMRGNSLTIGRGPENDVVLPDPDRLISKNHCAIEDHGGNVVVIDFSTNGTFLNYGKVPLGRVTTPLNDGDVLTMGTYELVVAISQGRSRDPMADIAPPMEDVRVSHGQAHRAPDAASLLDDPMQGGDFLDDLLGDANPPKGPGQIKRDDPYDPMMLPPLGDDDDPLLGPKPTRTVQGASVGSHTSAVSDSFSAAPRRSAIIPDDWEEDFLALSRPAARTPAPPPPPAARPPALPDDLDDLLGAAPPSRPAPPVIPEVDLPAPMAPALPDSFAPDAADGDPFAEAPRELAPAPVSAPVVTPVAPVAAPPVATPVAVAPVTPADHAAARAFLAAVGAADVKLDDADLPATMTKLGGVLRAMIEGLREILMTRTSIKSEFRMNQTMIGAGRNNPLKFSVTPEQAIEAMVRPTAKGYLDAQTATAEALRDIKAHEVAMVTGMEAALRGVLARLDPKALEEKIDAGAGFSSLLKGKKARYWEVYEKLYAEISDQAENDFHELFSKEFARAYQDQLERLK